MHKNYKNYRKLNKYINYEHMNVISLYPTRSSRNQLKVTKYIYL